MTRNEALRVFHHIPFYDTYAKGGRLDKIEDSFDYEKVINYLMSLDISVDDAIKFVEGDVDFADMDNTRRRDDHDNLLIDEDGSISSWTETCGTVYYLKDMNKLWKDYEPSEEEILEQQRRDAERSKHFKEMMANLLEKEIPHIIESDLVTVKPIKGEK